MRIIPYSSNQSGNRYGVAVCDMLGNIAVDVQRASNTIAGCLQSIKRYAKDVPFACAMIYRRNRKGEALPVKEYNTLETAKIVAQ